MEQWVGNNRSELQVPCFSDGSLRKTFCSLGQKAAPRDRPHIFPSGVRWGCSQPLWLCRFVAEHSLNNGGTRASRFYRVIETQNIAPKIPSYVF